MNKRITALRKALKMNKSEFARELGMTEGAIRSWESNKGVMKESSILLIIRTFNVNPEWLRDGKGEMFKPTLIPEAEQLVAWLKSLPEKEQAKVMKKFTYQIPEFKKWQESL